MERSAESEMCPNSHAELMKREVEGAGKKNVGEREDLGLVLSEGRMWREGMGCVSQEGRERQELFNYPLAEARRPRRYSSDSSSNRDMNNRSTTQYRPLATCTVTDQ